MRILTSTLWLAVLATAAPANSNHGTHYTVPNHSAAPFSNSQTCFTYQTLGSVRSIPTKYATNYLRCTTTITSTATTTSTPSPVTSTIISTGTSTVTAPTSLSTATSTETDTTITTVTSTTTNTVISVVSSTLTTTSTVSTTPGFIPIRSSLPGSSYDGSGGADPIAKRDVHSPSNAKDKSPNGLALHAASVLCTLSTTSSRCLSTVTTSTSTATASTSTISTTTTTTVTTTVVPSATTTITTTTTSTSTITSSVSTATTVTTTSMVATATTTLYAACATNNFATQYNGVTISEINGHGTYDSDVESTQNTAYDCCVVAFTSPLAIQSFLFQPSTNTCLIQYFNVEPQGAAQTSHQIEAIAGNTVDPPAVVGNGPYGEINTATIV